MDRAQVVCVSIQEPALQRESIYGSVLFCNKEPLPREEDMSPDAFFVSVPCYDDVQVWRTKKTRRNSTMVSKVA